MWTCFVWREKWESVISVRVWSKKLADLFGGHVILKTVLNLFIDVYIPNNHFWESIYIVAFLRIEFNLEM